MRRKKPIILLLSLNVALIAVLGGLIYQKHLELEHHQEMRDDAYRQAFLELTHSVAEIDVALQKCRYATSPALVTALSTEIYGRAVVARLSLERLPFPVKALEEVSGFVIRVGDYARALARGAYEGNGHSEEEFANLSALSKSASLLAGHLTGMAEEILSGELRMAELLDAVEELGGLAEVFSGVGGGLRSGQTAISEGFALIYDGSYSDHLRDVTPRALEGLDEVSMEEAKGNVSAFFDLKKSIFSYIGSRGGEIPAYRFLARVDGGDFAVEVSKVGGRILGASNDRNVRSSPLTTEEGLGVARAFFARNGYEDMELRHWWVEENRVTARFVNVIDDLVFYPDWMLVSVALDNGRVLEFDGMGYVMSHGPRAFEEPGLSIDDALTAIPEQLTVLRHELAVILSSGRYELLCFAFLCRDEEGRRYMVYVNAETGRQQEIRILYESEEGSFTL